MRKFKKKNLPFFEKVLVSDIGAEGKAIAKHEGLVIFVENAVAGDVADLKVFTKKSKYMIARAVNFHTLSDKRTEPVCEHFGVCGGCKWQNLAYEHQLFFKHQEVFNNFTRIGKIEIPEILPVVACEKQYFYRNKLEYTFSNSEWIEMGEKENTSETEEDSEEEAEIVTDIPPAKTFQVRNALGFHVPKRFDKILDIKKCHLQSDPSNAIRLAARQFSMDNNYEFFDLRRQKGFVRNIIIRTATTGDVMVIMVFYYNDEKCIADMMNFLGDSFPEITSLNYIVNTKANDSVTDCEAILYKGTGYITETMEDLKFRIAPLSFFQTNPEQALTLYRITREFAGISPDDLVYDLYSGTGTITNFVARQAKFVLGMEYVEKAVEDARHNSEINGISNTAFVSGDLKDLLGDKIFEQYGKPDIIITDPPRAGMHADVVKQMLVAEPKVIVYVSCNPATQARDLALLDEKYKVEKIQPVDMFPNTHHIENVVKLRLKPMEERTQAVAEL